MLLGGDHIDVMQNCQKRRGNREDVSDTLYLDKLSELKANVGGEVAKAKSSIEGTRSLIPESFSEAYTIFKTNVKNLFASEAEYENKIKVLDSKYNEGFVSYLDQVLLDPAKELGDDYNKGDDKIRVKIEDLHEKFASNMAKIHELRDEAVSFVEKFKDEALKNFSNEMKNEKIHLDKYNSIEAEFMEIFSIYEYQLF